MNVKEKEVCDKCIWGVYDCGYYNTYCLLDDLRAAKTGDMLKTRQEKEYCKAFCNEKHYEKVYKYARRLERKSNNE